MISPSLFLACFLTLAANPALVHSLPLPPPTRAAAASFPQQHFAAPAPTPTLRIVDEDANHDTILTSWDLSDNGINPDTLFADSILPGGAEASLSAVLASTQVAKIDHVRRVLKHREQGKRMKRSLSSKEERKAEKKKRNGRKEKRFAPRRAAQQAAASRFAPGLGACGTTATSNSPIVAVSHLLYDTFPGATANPNLNPICGQTILATYGGTSVEVTVQDRCEGCAMWDLDFSPSVFEQLANLDVGRLEEVQWTFL
ncbi:hypothetical protein JCM5296_007031 [Sporobolomyces johnsonii]